MVEEVIEMPQDGRPLHQTRRGFLRLLASGAVGYALDVDKLLWVPGAKTFFLPSIKKLTTAEILDLELKRISPRIMQLFARDDAFYQTINKRDFEVISSRPMRIPLEIKND